MSKILSIKSQLRGGDYELSAEDSEFLIEQSLTQNPEATLIAGLIIFNEAQSTLTEQIAFGYIKRSAESGFAPAMIFLANLYLEGAVCTADHSSALYWLERHIEKGAPYYELKIFPYMLQWFEFRRGLEISFNGKKYKTGEGEIKSLNIWSLKCKKRIYEKQLHAINENPDAFGGGKTRTDLPLKGSIGGTFIKLAGPDAFEELIFDNPVLASSLSLPLVSLGFNSNELPSPSNLETLTFGTPSCSPAMSIETCKSIREAYLTTKNSNLKKYQSAKWIERLARIPNVFLKKEPFSQSAYEISFSFTSVGCFGHFSDKSGKKLVSFDYT